MSAPSLIFVRSGSCVISTLFNRPIVNANVFFCYSKLNRVMNMTRYVSVINYGCERNNQFRFSLFFFAPFLRKKQQIKDELCEVVQEMESHDSENKHSSKEKQMSIGRKKFNMDPKKGEYAAGRFYQIWQRRVFGRAACAVEVINWCRMSFRMMKRPWELPEGLRRKKSFVQADSDRCGVEQRFGHPFEDWNKYFCPFVVSIEL